MIESRIVNGSLVLIDTGSGTQFTYEEASDGCFTLKCDTSTVHVDTENNTLTTFGPGGDVIGTTTIPGTGSGGSGSRGSGSGGGSGSQGTDQPSVAPTQRPQVSHPGHLVEVDLVGFRFSGNRSAIRGTKCRNTSGSNRSAIRGTKCRNTSGSNRSAIRGTKCRNTSGSNRSAIRGTKCRNTSGSNRSAIPGHQVQKCNHLRVQQVSHPRYHLRVQPSGAPSAETPQEPTDQPSLGSTGQPSGAPTGQPSPRPEQSRSAGGSDESIIIGVALGGVLFVAAIVLVALHIRNKRRAVAAGRNPLVDVQIQPPIPLQIIKLVKEQQQAVAIKINHKHPQTQDKFNHKHP